MTYFVIGELAFFITLFMALITTMGYPFDPFFSDFKVLSYSTLISQGFIFILSLRTYLSTSDNCPK
jgi:hypothetical protein